MVNNGDERRAAKAREKAAEQARVAEPDFFEIDFDALDQELADQPKTYYHHALKLAEARAEHQRAEARLGVVEAEVEMEVRTTPAEFGLEKVTEATVQAAVKISDRTQKAREVCIQRRHDMDVCLAAVNALDHKKKSLEKAVELFLANYFAAPRLPKGEEARDAAKEMRQKRIRSRSREE